MLFMFCVTLALMFCNKDNGLAGSLQNFLFQLYNFVLLAVIF